MSDQQESTITIGPWPDTLIERTGHDPRSEYVEQYWLPIVGPSSLLAYRRIGPWVQGDDTLTINADELARSLGIGGRRVILARTFDRLITFHAARWNDTVFEVRRRLPSLPPRFVAQLPTSLQIRHERDRVQRSSDRLVTA